MRVYEVVLARIEDDLASGRLERGGRLPGERALAEQLGVSRPSVREAVRVLEAMGVVRTGVGSGPDAGAVVVDGAARGIGAVMRLHLAARTLPVADVVELRVLVEGWAAGEAAERLGRAREPADDDTLARVHALLAAMDAEDDPDVFLEHDVAFHLALVGLAQNVLVDAVMSGIRGAVTSYVQRGVQGLPSWPDTVSRLRAEHRAIAAAVEGGDLERAQRLAREHVRHFSAEAGLSDD